MAILNKYKRIPLQQIHFIRDERQRREVSVDDLLPSIKRFGVTSPILVHQVSESHYNLIYGERRLTASLELKLLDIPARLSNDLSVHELKLLELEENIRRKDLPWQDLCLAIHSINSLYMKLEENWNTARTGEAINLDISYIRELILIAEELLKGDKKVNEQLLACPGYRAAYNIIQRKQGRLMDDAINDLLGGEHYVETNPSEEDEPSESLPSHPISAGPSTNTFIKPRQTRSRGPNDSILCTDFTTWVANYAGPPFNFVHCDFPYGIGLDKSDQGNSERWGSYRDTEDTYWKLVEVFCTSLDKIMAPSSHLMFWLSSDIEVMYDTLNKFEELAPSLEFLPKPLIWHKTDNRGILPDPKRGPRHVYETALIASRGDRHIVTSVSDTYGAPSSKEIHQSEKPEPVLRHFFRMFIDAGTSCFDPTCGSGTSLRAAESLGAPKVLGLEINQEWADAANSKLRAFRTLRAASAKIAG